MAGVRCKGYGWLSPATEDPEDSVVAGTFIWAVWAASSSQRGQGLSPAPKSMASQTDSLPIQLHPLFPTVSWKRQVGTGGH